MKKELFRLLVRESCGERRSDRLTIKRKALEQELVLSGHQPLSREERLLKKKIELGIMLEKMGGTSKGSFEDLQEKVAKTDQKSAKLMERAQEILTSPIMEELEKSSEKTLRKVVKAKRKIMDPILEDDTSFQV